ncbi:MAG: hypothetical protein CML51_05995 [Rhodobacteraceae bacterium]|nr:hypothetical protein [Paracoccaceae bacterium]|tara:strand:+ start:909 stop:1865 length:957 start_codon:yes stop_codon:yes gene_type:complete
MKIERLGKIFDPTQHLLPLGCEAYAQSPQTLVFNDYVRIYFSTRARDQGGKFLSHVAYVDVDHKLERILDVSHQEIIPLGALGCFDEHGIFPFHVLHRGDEIFAYTTGWSRRTSVSVETGVGLAVSNNHGKTFTRVGNGPILTASLNEPFLVGDAFVRFFNNQFHMWYMYGVEWRPFLQDGQAERIYKIGHATSTDGINWEKTAGTQIIADALGPDESQALPSVIEADGAYHMFFCYRESFDFRQANGRGYRIGYARSEDLIRWHRTDTALAMGIPDGDWDSEMQAYPHIFNLGGRLILLYNGNEFGRFGFGAAEVFF